MMDNESMEEEMEISRTMRAVFYIEGIGIISVGVIGCLINLAAIWRLTIGQVSISPTFYARLFCKKVSR
jgi:hypothetical protein